MWHKTVCSEYSLHTRLGAVHGGGETATSKKILLSMLRYIYTVKKIDENNKNCNQINSFGAKFQMTFVICSFILFIFFFVLRFYGPVNPMGLCQAQS